MEILFKDVLIVVFSILFIRFLYLIINPFLKWMKGLKKPDPLDPVHRQRFRIRTTNPEYWEPQFFRSPLDRRVFRLGMKKNFVFFKGYTKEIPYGLYVNQAITGYTVNSSAFMGETNASNRNRRFYIGIDPANNREQPYYSTSSFYMGPNYESPGEHNNLTDFND